VTKTAKHQKVLALAATKSGCPTGLYVAEASELRAAGLIERREHISAVGARSLRWFQRQTEAA
jgi:hypothetical protein